MTRKQKTNLDSIEQKFLGRLHSTVSDLAQKPESLNSANWSPVLGQDTPFLSYCSLFRQERISRRIEKLTWALSFFTVVLVILTGALILLEAKPFR